MSERLVRPAAALVVATYGLLVFGASVRVHGAGLACPDWPLCFGELVPTIDFQVALEFGHRVYAGLVGLGFLALGLAVGRAHWTDRSLGRAPLVLVGLATLALITQIVLGGLTVLELLAEWTVTSHLVTGNLFCLLLLLLTLSLRQRAQDALGPRPVVEPMQRVMAVGVALLVPIQLALGGLIASTNAGLACGTWPTCDGTNWFPMFTGPVGLQIVHRLVAYGLLLAAWGGTLASRRKGRAAQAAQLVALTVTLQAAIGVANVLLRMPVEITLLHTAGAAAVVLSTTWWNFEVWTANLSPSASAQVAEDAAPRVTPATERS